MTTEYVHLDVRPILHSGGEPFDEIMKAVAALRPGQGLRLLATFKPVPLFSVLGAKGFTHDEKELDGGDWEVLFRPRGQGQAPKLGLRPHLPTPRPGRSRLGISTTAISIRLSPWSASWLRPRP